MREHRRSIYLSVATLIGLLAVTTPLSLANPIPGAGLMVNVGVDPVILTRCEDVVEHTTDVGQLTFDAYYYPYMYILETGELGMASVSAEFTWPPEWSLVAAYGPSEGGTGTFVPSGSGYSLDWTFSDCPRITLDAPLFHIGRFVLNVTGLGDFRADVGGAFSCYPGSWEIEPADGSARAGVECAYCDQPCSLRMPSWTEFDPPELAIEAQQGNDAIGNFTVTLNDMNLPESLTFESDADWLELGWHQINYWQVELAVVAHTGNLEPGLHSARVRGITEDCTGCAWVQLTVLPGAQGIEEPVDPSPQPPDPGITWGHVKELYR